MEVVFVNIREEVSFGQHWKLGGCGGGGEGRGGNKGDGGGGDERMFRGHCRCVCEMGKRCQKR